MYIHFTETLVFECTSDALYITQELQEWADKSGDAGFIYFSLGSAVKPSDMPEE